MVYSFRAVFTRLALAVGLVLLSVPVAAEQEEHLEEILITAERREVTLQKTPLSVTAFSSTQLEQLGIQNARDLNTFTPNLFVSQDAKGSIGFFTTSRGVGNADTAQIQSDPTTAVYIDGVYNGISLGNLFDIVDLERVEVLRGPQGTLYGRNTNGGAINFVTRKPSGDWGTSARFTGGSAALSNFRAYLENPVWGGEKGFEVPEALGTLSTSFSFMSLQRDPYFPNAFGKDIDERGRIAGRIAARWQGPGGVMLDYGVDMHRVRESGSTMQLTSVFNDPNGFLENGILFGNTGGTMGTDIRPWQSYARLDRLDVNRPKQNEVDLVGHGITVYRDWAGVPVLGGFTLKAVFGYRSVDFENTDDRDGTPYEIFLNTETATKNQTNLDLNVVGTTAGDHFDYVVGYYYFTEEGHSVVGQEIRQDPQYDAVNLGTGARDWGLTQTIFPEIDNSSHAVYGHFGYKLPILEDRIKLEAGVRYTREERHFSNRQVTTVPVNSITGLPVGSTTTFAPRSDSVSFDDVSPMGRISWQATDDLLTYFSVSRGFKAGGFNGRATSARAFIPFDSETLVSYEAGFKWQFLDGRAQLNANGFFSDYEDMHRSVLVSTGAGGGTTAVILNAADSEIWGSEVEFVALPYEGVRVDGSYGLTLGEFKDFPDLDPVTGLVRDFSDERKLSNAPEHSVHVGAQYSLPSFSWGTLTARVDYTWQSTTYLQNGDEPKASQGDYGLFNMRLSLDEVRLPGNGGVIDVGFWGRNLLDRNYKDFGIDFQTNTKHLNVSFPWIVQSFGEQRTFGVDLVWRWGTRG